MIKLSKISLEYLKSRGVKRNYEIRKLYSLTQKETKTQFAATGESLVIPYFYPNGLPIKDGGRLYKRARVFSRRVFGANLEPKFKQMRHAMNHVYFDPSFKKWETVCKDSSVPIIITEGEVKAMAANDKGFITVALGGVWSWRTRIGGVSQPIPDLDLVNWEDRPVYICFDSDIEDNPQVLRAEMALADELKFRGAEVYAARLPPNDNDDKQGLDDFLVNNSKEDLFELMKNAEEPLVEPIIQKINNQYGYVILGGRDAIVREQGEDFDFITCQALKTYFKNKAPVKVNDDVVPIFNYWLSHPARREYTRVVFDPLNKQPLESYNMWRGFAVQPDNKGSCQKFLNHLYNNIANQSDQIYHYIISWMANIVQNPDQKAGVSIVMRGGRGTGKGVFSNYFGKIFGKHFVELVNTKHLLGNFNSHLKDKLVVYADEAFWAGDKSGENILKFLITAETLNVEFKGKDMFDVRNYVNIIIAANNDWCVPAGLDERRFLVIQMNEKHKQDRKYFARIIEEQDAGGVEALLYYLLHYDIQIDVGEAPMTRALLDQKIYSMDPVERFWFEKLKDGKLSYRKDATDWEKSSVKIMSREMQSMYSESAKEFGARHRSNSVQLGMKLKQLCHKMEIKRFSTKGKREKFYCFPPLSVCRSLFEDVLMGEVPWEDV